MPDSTQAGFRQWLSGTLGAPEGALSIQLIAGDASPRQYFRIRPASGHWSDIATALLSDLAGDGSVIGVTAPATENNEAFLHIQSVLKRAGLRVPRQFAAVLDHGWMLMEDFGDDLLLPNLSDRTADSHYGRAIDAIARISTIPPEQDMPRFDTARITEELSVFPEWFLQQLLGFAESDLPPQLFADLNAFLVEIFTSQLQCLVHRDFHSRNLMCLPGGELGVIDFQDAVIGPVTYDPVSLFKDCYVRWPRADQLRWLEMFRCREVELGLPMAEPDQFVRDFDLVGLQRHLRVLGVFARLHLRDGKSDYLDDLPLVLHYTREALALYRAEPAIGAFASWFESEVMSRVAAQRWYTSAVSASELDP